MPSLHPPHKLEKPKAPLAADNRRTMGRTGQPLRYAAPALGGPRLQYPGPATTISDATQTDGD